MIFSIRVMTLFYMGSKNNIFQVENIGLTKWVLFRDINDCQFISTTNLRCIVRMAGIFYIFLLHVYAQKKTNWTVSHVVTGIYKTIT